MPSAVGSQESYVLVMHAPAAALMQEHGIGQGFALYYIAHAAYLELRGSYKRAEAVFQAGLDRCAPDAGQTLLPYCASACMPHAAAVGNLGSLRQHALQVHAGIM